MKFVCKILKIISERIPGGSSAGIQTDISKGTARAVPNRNLLGISSVTLGRIVQGVPSLRKNL